MQSSCQHALLNEAGTSPLLLRRERSGLVCCLTRAQGGPSADRQHHGTSEMFSYFQIPHFPRFGLRQWLYMGKGLKKYISRSAGQPM